MADIKVERKPGTDFDKRWLLAPLVLALLAIMAIWAAQTSNDRPAGQQASLPLVPLAQHGQVWLPQGPPVLLPDRQMVAIGETVGGLALYEAPVPAGGGGGLVAPNPHNRSIYVRVGEDQYQRVVLTPVTPRQ